MLRTFYESTAKIALMQRVFIFGLMGISLICRRWLLTTTIWATASDTGQRLPSSPTNSQTSSSTSFSTNTQSQTGTPNPTSDQVSKSSGLSTGAKAGIGIGATAAIFILGLVAFLLGRRSKGKNTKTSTLAEDFNGKADLPNNEIDKSQGLFLPSMPSRPSSRQTKIVDPFTSTAQELQALLTSGKVTSVDLVKQSLHQIDLYDHYLRAVLAVSPEALNEAHRLHQERMEGKIRGPLHGIPILVKDNIATHHSLGMDTTAGSYALVGSRPKSHAAVIDKLRDAGAIIIAKTQLSEFAFFKGNNLPSGWSALGGQAQSAYTFDDVQPGDEFLGHSSPAGSSTGSAVGVSAGYAPLSIGTDTTGSVILPATRAALYGLRVTPGIIPMEGIIPVSKTFDSVGLMSKTVHDLANLLDALTDSAQTTVPLGGYGSDLDRGWRKLRVGVLDPEKWSLPAFAARPNPDLQNQINAETRAAYDRIRKVAGGFYDVQLISLDKLDMPNGKGLFDLFEADFKQDFESYLLGLESSKVRSLKEIIDFNEAHRSLELPKGYSHQETLIAALNNNMTYEDRQALFAHVRRTSRQEGIDKTLDKHKIDVILGPADCGFNLLVCASGYPSATMPLSYADFNGRPFGVFALTKAHGEHLLLQVLKAWEGTFPPRKPPKGLSKL